VIGRPGLPQTPVGDGPESVAAADLNGDGKPDLAVANERSDEVSVLLNLGNGTFTPAVNYTVGSSPISIAAADLDGDGKPDLAVANSEDASVSVLLNLGDGTFAPPAYYAVGSNPYSVAAADFNGDGNPELAVANWNSNGTVSLLVNQGDGTFAPPVYYAAGSGSRSVAAADLNGDGKPDLVVANWNSVIVSVLLNLGNGTFAAKVDYAVGDGPVSISAADVNGDGTLDLAVAETGDCEEGCFGGKVSVLLNLGDGSFSPPVDHDAGRVPSSVTAADLNGDGKLDLVVSDKEECFDYGCSGGGINVLLNLGDGTFAAKVNYTVGADPDSVVAMDLNGDGKPDLAATSYYSDSISVLLNHGDGTLFAAVTYTPGWFPDAVAAADLNGDGRPDLTVANWGVSVLLNLGNGTFAEAVNYTAGTLPDAVAAVDLNGDGMPDLAVANAGYSGMDLGSVSVLLNLGNGTFAEAVDYDVGTKPNSVAAADLNGDGKPDLAVTCRLGGDMADGGASVLLNLGNGAFAPAVHYAAGSFPVSVAAADLNGDGMPDLAVINLGDGQGDADMNDNVSVLVNLGNGTFAAGIPYGAGVSPDSVTAADLNGDGMPDLAVTNHGGYAMANSSVSVLLNLGNGTFATAVDYDADQDPHSVLAADVNSDDKLDLVVGSRNKVSVLLNQGNGTFAAGVGYDAGAFPLSVTAADLNGDGKPDLAAASDSGVSVLLTTCLP
jgi:hypothetical protein